METGQPSTKRKRLSHACTWCRSKKIRCDELQPKCTNCVRSNVDCVTFDPRTLAAVQRREAQSQPALTAPPAASITPQVLDRSDTETGSSPQPSALARGTGPESPAVSSPLLPVLPRFLNGNSLSVLTQWLDLAFARLGMTERLHHAYNHIRSKEQRPSYATDARDLSVVLPTYAQSASTYALSLGRMFPVTEEPLPGGSSNDSQVRRDSYVENGTPLNVGGENLNETPNRPTPLHAMLHAVNCSVGESVERSAPERCFGYAYNHLPAILEGTGTEALDSIRTLILMSLYLRWRDDMEKAWQMLSLSVACVQNQGLHRESKASAPESSSLFWSIFVLDKLLSTELERKPLLANADCDRRVPHASQHHQDIMLRAILDLSKIQEDILERSQLSRRAEEEAHAMQFPINHIVESKLRLVGELDLILLQFADRLPQGLKPTDYLYADSALLPALTFLAVQYHQTVFLVSRNALLVNMQSANLEIDKAFQGLSYTNRLKSGINVCVHAVRSILNVLNHAEEMGVRSPLFTLHAPLMAMYALTIHVVRRQSPTTARIDLELQATAMALIRKHQNLQPNKNTNQDDSYGLLGMLEKLHSFSESFVHRSSPAHNLPKTSTTAVPNMPATTDIDQRSPMKSSARVISPPQSPTYETHSPARGHASNAQNAISGSAFETENGSTALPYSDFNDDWIMNLGNDSFTIDWDELAMTLGLPAEPY